jgi:hypothetical protein
LTPKMRSFFVATRVRNSKAIKNRRAIL